jgi:predicted enzyme related to lactoylglutathione lyase
VRSRRPGRCRSRTSAVASATSRAWIQTHVMRRWWRVRPPSRRCSRSCTSVTTSRSAGTWLGALARRRARISLLRYSSAPSDPDDYGFIELLTAHDGVGIRGGIGGGPAHEPHAIFYVRVDDVARTLECAERLGASRRMGPETAPNGLVAAHFADPAGNLIGLAGG